MRLVLSAKSPEKNLADELLESCGGTAKREVKHGYCVGVEMSQPQPLAKVSFRFPKIRTTAASSLRRSPFESALQSILC